MNVFLSISPQDWLDTVLSAVVLGGLVLGVEWIRWVTDWPAETTRRMAHVGTGLLVFMAPLFMVSPVPALVLGSIFTVVNFLAVRRGWFRSMHDTQRRTYGTVYYPLAFTVLAGLCWVDHKMVVMLSMGVLAVGDVMAAWVGGRVRKPHRYNLGGDAKSWEGSAVMLMASFLVILACLYYLFQIGVYQGNAETALWLALIAAVVATVAEGISVQGSDNLTIPLGVAWVVYLMLHAEYQWQLVHGFLMALVAAVASYRFRFLDLSGCAAAFLLGVVIFGAGGWTWAVPILVFFVSSSVWSKMGKKRKESFELIFEKGHTRDAGQVLANGGVAGLVVVASVLWPSVVWPLAYVGSVAAVTADTWATEIGIYFGRTPVSIARFTRTQPGESGGVTWPGMLGATAGAALTAVTGHWVFEFDRPWLTLSGVIGSGVAASLVDSWLGATVQAQYRCTACGRSTERVRHCDRDATWQRGLRWINNDVVNIACGVAGAVVMAGFMFVIA